MARIMLFFGIAISWQKSKTISWYRHYSGIATSANDRDQARDIVVKRTPRDVILHSPACTALMQSSVAAAKSVGCWLPRSSIHRIMELSLLRTFAPGSESTMVWNFRSLELSLPRHVTFGHRRRLHGGNRPHGQKVVGAMPLSCPHRNFDAIFETVIRSVKL